MAIGLRQGLIREAGGIELRQRAFGLGQATCPRELPVQAVEAPILEYDDDDMIEPLEAGSLC